MQRMAALKRTARSSSSPTYLRLLKKLNLLEEANKIMSRWLNRKFRRNWKPWRWRLVVGGSVISVLLLTFVSIVFATTTTWDFSAAGSYTCEKVDNSTAACVSAPTAVTAGPVDEVYVS